MAGSINKVILVGNLGKDPEVKHSQDGNKIVTFNIATSETWKDKSGEKKDEQNGTELLSFPLDLLMLLKNTLKKVQKFMWKVNFVLVNGKMQAVLINIQPKLFYPVSMHI